MISLKEYIFLEDENKFVKIDYKTTVNTEENDDVQISSPLLQDVEGEDGNLTAPPIEGGVDAKLVGEIRLYSETSSIFNERKRKIAEKFKNLLNALYGLMAQDPVKINIQYVDEEELFKDDPEADPLTGHSQRTERMKSSTGEKADGI